jgi:hypothetical protein
MPSETPYRLSLLTFLSVPYMKKLERGYNFHIADFVLHCTGNWKEHDERLNFDRIPTLIKNRIYTCA